MAETTNRVAEMRKARGLTQQQVAEKLGVHWITISKIERGIMQLTGEWLERLSAALDVDQADLLARKARSQAVDVSVMISDQGHVFRPQEEDRLQRIELDPVESAFGFWALVDTVALWPAFQPGDLVYFADILPGEYWKFDSKFAYMILEDNRDFFGVFEASNQDGLFNVRPLGSKPIRNVRLRQVAAAREARFQPWDRQT